MLVFDQREKQMRLVNKLRTHRMACLPSAIELRSHIYNGFQTNNLLCELLVVEPNRQFIYEIVSFKLLFEDQRGQIITFSTKHDIYFSYTPMI